MGILDKKERVLDVVVTNEGKRQLASGEFQIKFASFTDRDSYYQGVVNGAQDDANSRLYFEANSRIQDQIIFELDDSGGMRPFKASEFKIFGTKIISGSILTGSEVTSFIDDALQAQFSNLTEQYLIGTNDLFADSNDFELTPTSHTFQYTKDFEKHAEANIENIESLWQDTRLSHLDNFKFLPPVTKRISGQDETLLATYESYKQKELLTFQDLEKKLLGKSAAQIKFTETSRDNNLFAQILESKPDEIKKLVLIDFGEFINEDLYRGSKRVFFAGKIFRDENGSHTFVNIFTIIFHSTSNDEN